MPAKAPSSLVSGRYAGSGYSGAFFACCPSWAKFGDAICFDIYLTSSEIKAILVLSKGEMVMKIRIEYFSALQRRWIEVCVTSNYKSCAEAMERYYTDTGIDPVRVRASEVVG